VWEENEMTDAHRMFLNISLYKISKLPHLLAFFALGGIILCSLDSSGVNAKPILLRVPPWIDYFLIQ